MQRVAAVAKQEAEAKFEAEKRSLQLKLESEITQLQTHLRIFQKVSPASVSCWLLSLVWQCCSFHLRGLFLSFSLRFKVERWLERDEQLSEMSREQQEAWGQLDKASHENRHLKLSLVDAQATLALLQTELSQVRSHYEEKIRLLQR